MTAEKQIKKGRNFGLDIIRTFSIWLVLLQHAGWTPSGFEHLKVGVIGVEVFFVLSGFLIGGILFRELQKENSWASIKRFWIRRWYRILPVYYLFLAIKFFFIDSSVGTNIFYYIFFLQNHFYGIDYYGVTWSLVIEEWFYIVAPIFVFVAFKITKNLKLVGLLLFGFIIFENIARYVYVSKTGVPYGGVSGSVPFRFDSLFVGVALAFIKHYFSGLFKKLQSPLVLIAGILGITAYLYWIASISYPVDQFDSFMLPKTIGFFLLSFLIALVVPFFYTIRSINTNNWLSKIFYQFVHQTSILTYSIYLVHMLIFSRILKNESISSSFQVQFWLSIALTYIASWLVYRFYEKPILDFRDRKVK